jgi:hypothetical protein
MKHRVLWLALLVSLGPAAAAQDPSSNAPRTEWDEPALEGLWLTANVQGRPFAQPDEGSDASLLSQLVESGAVDRVSRLEPDQTARRERAVLDEWKATHASPPPLVIEPADGRMPPLTAEARQRALQQWRTTHASMGPWAGPADMGPVERCISRGPIGSMLPSVDYSAIQIVQAPGLVTIRSEAIHEARVIPIGAADRAVPQVRRSYMGEARGFWDGDTLVVETANFNGRTGAHAGGNETPTSTALTVTERFTRTSADAIAYEMRVVDPQTWTAPWRVAYSLAAAPDYSWSEYACHEGNYAMRNLLSISRAAEGTPVRPVPPAASRPTSRPALPPLPQRPPRPRK